MRTALEQLVDAAPTPKEKAVRRVEEAGVLYPPETSSKIATARLRTAIAELTEANFTEIQGWLDYVAMVDPKGALDILLRMLEFSVPKLSRVEAQITDSGKTGLGDLTISELQAILVRERTYEGEVEDAEFSDIL